MKIKFLKLKNWLLLSAMSLLGLSACNCHKNVVPSEPEKTKDSTLLDRNRVVPMYGVPVSKYRNETIDTVVQKPKPREPQVTVYGVPTVDFAVKGKVVNAKGKPVKGLQVMLINSEIDFDNLPDTPHWKERLKLISDTTDNEGAFEVRTSDRPWETIRVMVRDIDGKQNGSYEDQLIEVDFGEPKKGNKPVSAWHLGERNAEVTVKMSKKK